MSRLTKALICAVGLSTVIGLSAQANQQLTSNSANTIQRYTFTYDFKNTVHPVVKRVKEQQQFIQYDIVTEVQQQAYQSISETGNSTLLAYQLVLF